MFELSFAPEFFIGPYDLDGSVDLSPSNDRPTSLYQAICAMPADDYFTAMARDVFGVEPEDLSAETILEKARETDTCSDLRSPVEVWIDPEGWYRVAVFDSRDCVACGGDGYGTGPGHCPVCDGYGKTPTE